MLKFSHADLADLADLKKTESKICVICVICGKKTLCPSALVAKKFDLIREIRGKKNFVS